MTRLLAINGSYRELGIIDQTLSLLQQHARETGYELEVANLRELPIGFCQNCRQCTQLPGEAPGTCMLQDGMQPLIASIEAADAYVLACPTNFATVTALFKRFMERLVVYAYWPWNSPAPKLRRKQRNKRAVLVASGGAPTVLGRVAFGTLQQLKRTARTIGAKPVGQLYLGRVGLQEAPSLPSGTDRKLKSLFDKLV